MRTLKFTKMYDHVFPSRGMINFPEGYEGPVKDEVADAAIEGGFATEAKSGSAPAADKK